MADILTHLRELSFGYGILKYPKSDFNDSPEEFLAFCKQKIIYCDKLQRVHISKNQEYFTDIEMKTIKNGLKLSSYVHAKKIIDTKKDYTVEWLGAQTQSGLAYDIMVNGVPFSLKEESFVLHNMGLYQLINIITDKDTFKRGIHIFEKYSYNELCNWFETTKKLMIEILIKETFQTFDSSDKIIQLSYSSENNTLKMSYNGIINSIKDFSNCNYEEFKKTTNGQNREKVFAKFINKKLSNNKTYLASKTKCAEEAGKSLLKFLNINIAINSSPVSLCNLFRIFEKPYYYAKVSNDIEVYRVPSRKEFSSKIQINNINYSIPASQLNICTTIQNLDTKETLTLRNELRYSHGQFNGTPEAKMYIDKGSLLIAYELIT